MSDYTPDKWVVIKISNKDQSPVYKVFACWYGGWAGADSWQLNSGITKSTLEGNVYSFEGFSGSVYHCHKNNYGTNLYGDGVLHTLIDRILRYGGECEILPEDTNWLGLKYE